MVCYRKDKKLVEGKTKIVWALANDPDLVMLESKDDITAGDGKKHDILEGKAQLSTETTCNVFQLLKSNNVPTAFHSKQGNLAFLATNCEMLPYEVVVRREAHGSYLKRYPHLKKGCQFDELLVEFYLKTANKEWRGKKIPKDDPLLRMTSGNTAAYLPDVPLSDQEPFMVLDGYIPYWEQMAKIARQTFALLEFAWARQGLKLVDFKVEFGLDAKNTLLLADVIDNDSWRLIENEEYVDKQVYRDDGDIDDVLRNYKRVAELSKSLNSFT